MSDHAKLIWPNVAEASQAKAIGDRAGPECSFVVRALIQRCRELEAARCYHETEASGLAEKLRRSEFLRNAPGWNGLASDKVEAAIAKLFSLPDGGRASGFMLVDDAGEPIQCPEPMFLSRGIVLAIIREHLGLKDEL